MSKISRHCPSCGRVMPYDWNKPHCKFCGGRVSVEIEERKNMEDVPMWDGQEDLSHWTKKYTPRERLTKHDLEEDDYIAVTETKKFGLTSLPPFFLLLFNICTLGLVSTSWILRRLLLMNDGVRREEKVKVAGFYIWIFSYVAALMMFGLAVWEYVDVFGMDWRPILTQSDQPILIALYFSLAFIMSRYYLFWIRDAVTDEVERKMSERLPTSSRLRSVAAYRFARSPLMFWFIGVPYLQFYINRMIKHGALDKDSFKPQSAAEPEPSP